MAFTPNSYLVQDPGTILRDQRHAANLFNVDQFRLAPKSNFLFHVAFGINTRALRNTSLVTTYGQEINMLVKSTDLPSFTISTDMLNQYNRKKIVQYKAAPNEIAIKFHDDNMGLINQVWQNYYSYYYADTITAIIPGAYARNETKAFSSIPANYGFDAGSTEPFFNYIKIYQMARHEYVCYQLWNPLITSWNHNKLSYSDSGLHDMDMKVQYEAVSYSLGKVEADMPEGFAVSHYDTHPSPLQASSNVTAGGPSFVNSSNPNLAAGALSSAIAQVNNYQNSQESSSPLGGAADTLAKAAGVAGVIGIGANLLGGLGSAAGGLSDISFPGAGAIGDALDSVGGAISDAASSVGNFVGGLFS